MNVSKISFKGYREQTTVLWDRPDAWVINALDKSRPFLKLLGNSMPENRDLVISVTDNGCDTFIRAFDYNKKKKKAKLLTEACEHTLTKNGHDFVKKVLLSLKNNSKSEFKEIASDYVIALHNNLANK